MTIHFYLPKKALNDATIYYTDLIKRAFIEEKNNVVYQNENNFKINKTEYIFTIRVRDFINVFFRTRSKNIIHWSQGIGPEEYLQTNNYTIKAYVVSFLFSVVEFITLRKTMFNIFVSEAMKKHYERKYFKKIDNYLVIPCYNKHLNKQFFDQKIKKNLSFVYAGSLDTWQCFGETIKLFKKINELENQATLTILTKQVEKAEAELKKHSVLNADAKYVLLENLDLELSKYQYGFLLREDHIINRVSTPTKMNSYLANGLIPIYTEVVDSFNKNIDLKKFEIKFKITDDFSEIAEQIVEQNNTINYDQFFDVCEQNFNNYYDDEYNILLLKKKMVMISKNSKF